MRLLAGIVAAAPFRTVLVGDASLSARPMERVAEPLRAMGATVRTTDGHAPIIVEGGTLRGIRHELTTPSAQVKSAILLAGMAATGRTTVSEPVPTRDHTERAISALGAPIERRGGEVSIGPFQHGGLEGSVPGDPSSAAFLLAAAAVTGAALTVEGVGLNPTRLGFVAVLARMGVRTVQRVWHEELGEPVGALSIDAGASLRGTRISGEELPGVIDEVPVLAAMAASAGSETRFEGAAELRVKESDRLSGIEAGLRAMGADVVVEGEDLIVAGTGLEGGTARSLGDHRLAMAFAVAALAARRPGEIEDAEVADVSYPGFFRTLASLGADVERSG
jgi:3-phosphoshikimate 1-carboxyvinyltransferase